MAASLAPAPRALYARSVQACGRCGKGIDGRYRFCPWCAAPLRSKLVEFFRPHADIERVLSIPLGTVKSRLRLAMNRLRNLLGELS